MSVTEDQLEQLCLDWFRASGYQRDSVRAKLRNLVRRCLRKWKYPPNRQDAAVELVLKQAEVLCCRWSEQE